MRAALEVVAGPGCVGNASGLLLPPDRMKRRGAVTARFNDGAGCFTGVDFTLLGGGSLLGRVLKVSSNDGRTRFGRDGFVGAAEGGIEGAIEFAGDKGCEAAIPRPGLTLADSAAEALVGTGGTSWAVAEADDFVGDMVCEAICGDGGKAIADLKELGASPLTLLARLCDLETLTLDARPESGLLALTAVCGPAVRDLVSPASPA